MSKYKAKRTEVHGISFASKAEADYYLVLIQQLEDGYISDLKLQPKFLFTVDGRPLLGYKGKRQLSYVGDFQYYSLLDDVPQLTVVDVKGWPTPDFRIKWALVRHCYPEIAFWLYTKGKGLHAS